MTSTAAPAAPAQDLFTSVRAKLEGAAPLKLADVAKGLPRPRKTKAPDFQEEVRKLLDKDIAEGRAFAYPSGKGGATRYWARDEAQVLAGKALELAAAPLPLPKLRAELAKQAAGTDLAFLDALLRDLIGQGRLHEHPAKSRQGGSSYGANPPPPPLPPLARAKFKRAVEKLTEDCRRLLAASGATEEHLFETLRLHLSAPPITARTPAILEQIAEKEVREEATEPVPSTPDDLIRRAVATSPVVSLADLRQEMPAEYRGTAFDEAVLRLAAARQVLLHREADPAHLSDADRAGCLRDGDAVYTTIAKAEGA